MSYTDGRDFEPEYTAMVDNMRVVIEVEKLGGGTLGRAYAGTWRYRVTYRESGAEIFGQDLHTGTPKYHSQIPGIVWDFLNSDDDDV